MKKNKFFTSFYAWFDMIILDHGFLRLLYHNFHKIDKNMYRSNMPTPNRIKKYKKMGIKTIINLRGGNKDGGWLLENEACKKNNIKLVNFVARSRSAPEKEMIKEVQKKDVPFREKRIKNNAINVAGGIFLFLLFFWLFTA